MRRLPVVAFVLAFPGLLCAPAGASPLRGGSAHPPGSPRASDALPAPVPCAGGSCWYPGLQTSWQWQLQGTVQTGLGVDMYDIDGFDASAGLVGTMQGEGAAVVCYISAGSWESWRPDRDDFPARVIGNRLDGWAGERWLDVRKMQILRPIMEARVDMCAAKGFDGVEFDNVDAHRSDAGFPLSGEDQLRYNVMLANEAHERGLSAAMKNDLGQIDALLPYFDYALNEQCHQYHECAKLAPFVDAGKAVFGVEYRLETGEFCPKAINHGFNFLKKKLDLRAWRIPCSGI